MDNFINHTYPPEDVASFFNFTERTLERILRTFVLPALILIGVFGNILAVNLIKRIQPDSGTAAFVYIICIANIIVLVMGAGLDAIAELSKANKFSVLNDWTCKLHTVADKTCEHWITWCSTVMGAERVVKTWKKSNVAWSAFKSKCVAVGIFFGVLSIEIHIMWSHAIDKQMGCYIDLEFHDFHKNLWPLVSAFINVYIPVVIGIGVCTALTIGVARNRSSQGEEDYLIECRRQEAWSRCALILLLSYILLKMPILIVNIVQYSNPYRLERDRKWLAQIHLADIIIQVVALGHYTFSPFMILLTAPGLGRAYNRLLSNIQSAFVFRCFTKNSEETQSNLLESTAETTVKINERGEMVNCSSV